MTQPTVYRQTIFVRGLGLIWVAFSVWWLFESRDPQSVVSLLIAVLLTAGSFRALIVVEDETVRFRGLRGWGAPVPLRELTKVSMRREPEFRRWPLVLRLIADEERQVSLECWAWERYDELAHLAGHYAAQLDAEADAVTRTRMRCNQPGCILTSEIAQVVGERRAAPAPDDSIGSMSVLGRVGFVAAFAVFGFLFVLVGVWLKDDTDTETLIGAALFSGVVFGIIGVGIVVWESVKPAKEQRLSAGKYGKDAALSNAYL